MKYLYNPESNRCIPYREDFAKSRPDFFIITEAELEKLRTGKKYVDILRDRTVSESVIEEPPIAESEKVKSEEPVSFAPPPRRRGGRRKKVETSDEHL